MPVQNIMHLKIIKIVIMQIKIHKTCTLDVVVYPFEIQNKKEAKINVEKLNK